MRTFGAFSVKGRKPFYAELIGDEVSVLEQPYWLGIEPTGEKIRRQDVEIRVPVSPSKLIAVGLNYAEHIAEMKRTPLGAALIWFKAATSHGRPGRSPRARISATAPAETATHSSSCSAGPAAGSRERLHLRGPRLSAPT